MRKVSFLIALFLLLALNFTYGSTWAKSYGIIRDEIAIDAVQLNDESFVVLLQSNPIENPCCDIEAVILLVDREGQVLRSQHLSHDGIDYPLDIDLLANGNIAIVGYSNEVNPSNTDAWIVVLDQNLDIMWKKMLRGIADGYDAFYSLTPTSDGGIVTVGATGTPAGSDAWFTKFNSEGTIQWQKAIGLSSVGENARSVIEASNGDYVTTGSSPDNFWITRIDPNGNLLWAKTYSAPLISNSSTILESPTGGFFVLGTTGGNGMDIFLMKVSDDGSLEWLKSYGGPARDYPSSDSKSMVVNQDGSVVFLGATESFGFGFGDFWILKTDDQGIIQWQKSIGGSYADEPKFIMPTADLGYLIGGRTYSFPYQPDSDAWLVKVNGSGDMDESCELSFDTYADPVDYSVSVAAANFIVNNTAATFTGPFTIADTPIFTDTQCGQNCPTILISPSTLPNGQVGQLYNQQLSATGGTAPYIFTLTNGTLPDGLFLSSDGLISGIPITQQTMNFKVTVTDSLGCNSVVPYSITILPTSSCLFCDDFNDGVLATDWTYSKGIWNESGGVLKSSPQRKAIAIGTPVFSGCASCTVQARLRTGGGIGNRVWLLGWYLDSDNYVELMMKEESDKWVLKQHSGGAVVAKQKGLQLIQPNTDYDAEISFDGTNFQVTINGQPLITMPKFGGTSPFGTVGFQIKATTGSFDFVSVF